MSSRFLKILSLALFLVVLPFTASAQQGSAIIQGTVVDQSGGALSDVAVTVRNDETGVSRSTVTDSVGHYRLPALQSGVYTIRVEHSGFSVEERKAMQLIVGQQLVADFTMKVGKVTETVEVAGAAPLVNTQQSQVEGTINQEQIAQ
jgi:protocatechuate 3,4-dioxygenase beta subunit